MEKVIVILLLRSLGRYKESLAFSGWDEVEQQTGIHENHSTNRASLVRRHGLEPWSGKIPHAAEQLGPCTTTTEPAL